jgi:hypothetical protein
MTEALPVFGTRPPIVGDPVVCPSRPDWNIGTVQATEGEDGLIVCGFYADHGYFQCGVRLDSIEHAAEHFRRLRATPSATAMQQALENWRNNLATTQGFPVAGDILHGPALDFVIEQLDSILARAAIAAMKGEG